MSERTRKLSAKIAKVRALVKGAGTKGEAMVAINRLAELVLSLERSVAADIRNGL